MPLEIVDPWHKYTSLSQDCIVVIEFAEDEGPKPVIYLPDCPGTHFDGNDFAVWLMTTDYQNSGYRGSFSLSSDIQMLLENEEQGVAAYVHYFTLYDIDARGFVRPFCAAYVTPNSDKTLQLFSSLKSEFTEQIDLLKYCNKRQFGKELTQALDALNTLESQAISAYYELCYDSDENVCSGGGGGGSSCPSVAKPETLNMRYRRLQAAIQVAHKCVMSDLETNHSPNFCSHHVNMDPWITSLRAGRSLDRGATPLKTFTALAPCAFDGFVRSMQQALNTFSHWDACLAAFFPDLGHSRSRSCYLKLGALPCLLLPSENGQLASETSSDCERCCTTFLPLTVSDGSFHGVFNHKFLAAYERLKRTDAGPAADRRLLSLSGNLKHVLYPLLTGQFTLVYGCYTRKSEVVAMVDALQMFVPCVHDEDSRALRWHEGRLPPTAFADFKLVGLLVPKIAELRDYLSDNIVPFVAKLNLNNDMLFAPEYQGRLLNKLEHVGHFHDSDRTFAPMVISVISELCLFAYVLYLLLLDGSRIAVSSYEQRLAKAMNILNLSKSDFKIVRYISEMLQSKDGDCSNANTLETMVLDYESSRLLKL